MDSMTKKTTESPGIPRSVLPKRRWPDLLLNLVAQQLVLMGYVAQRTPDRHARVLLAFVGVVLATGGIAEILWGTWPPFVSVLMLGLGAINLLTLLLYYLFRQSTS
jgi:CHASE2 domain-containing sensor protein